MSVHRQRLFTADVLAIVRGEPVGEGVVEVLHGFTGLAMRQADATLSRFVGDHHGETLIASAGPHCSLAEARKSKDSNLLSDDVGIVLQVVESAAEAPGP